MKSKLRRSSATAKPDYDSPDAAGDRPVAPTDADDAGDLDDFHDVLPDEADWDVFLADDDERDPLPEHGDFWDETPFD